MCNRLPTHIPGNCPPVDARALTFDDIMRAEANLRDTLTIPRFVPRSVIDRGWSRAAVNAVWECRVVDAAQAESRRMCRGWWEYVATMEAALAAYDSGLLVLPEETP